jgi:alpha-N-arabinofuranosidase
MLPVRWRDGWPTILRRHGYRAVFGGGTRLAARHEQLRNLMSGNFRVRDEFNTAALAPSWSCCARRVSRGMTFHSRRLANVARAIDPARCSRATGIRRTPAAARIDDRDDRDALHTVPSRRRRGLVAFQSDSFYYFLGETLRDGKPVVRLVRRAGPKDGGAEVTVAEAPLDHAAIRRCSFGSRRVAVDMTSRTRSALMPGVCWRATWTERSSARTSPADSSEP